MKDFFRKLFDFDGDGKTDFAEIAMLSAMLDEVQNESDQDDDSDDFDGADD